jgi:hypothetical protein
VANINTSLKLVNESMNKQHGILKLLGDFLNIQMGDPSIDPTKEEFTTLDVQVTQMFQDNHHPHF